MSRLTLTLALALALACVAPPAHAEANPNANAEANPNANTEANPNANAEVDENAAQVWLPLRWDFGARTGYAAPWTTAQSFVGPGTGLAAGVTFRIPIRLELGVLYHAGTTVSAGNDSIPYWSRQWSMLGHAGAGYELAMLARRFVVRPRLIAAAVLLSETTLLGTAMHQGLEPIFAVGPAADLLVRFGALHAGIDARALFVPARVAAPIGGLYGVFGFER